MKIRSNYIRPDNERIFFGWATYGKLGLIRTAFVSGDSTYINSFNSYGKSVASYQTLTNAGFEISNSIVGSSSVENMMYDTINNSWWMVIISRNDGLAYAKITTGTLSKVPKFRDLMIYYI